MSTPSEPTTTPSMKRKRKDEVDTEDLQNIINALLNVLDDANYDEHTVAEELRIAYRLCLECQTSIEDCTCCVKCLKSADECECDDINTGEEEDEDEDVKET